MVTLSESGLLILHLAVDVKVLFERGKKFPWVEAFAVSPVRECEVMGARICGAVF
jgi:hypothetical protein